MLSCCWAEATVLRPLGWVLKNKRWVEELGHSPTDGVPQAGRDRCLCAGDMFFLPETCKEHGWAETAFSEFLKLRAVITVS